MAEARAVIGRSPADERPRCLWERAGARQAQQRYATCRSSPASGGLSPMHPISQRFHLSWKHAPLRVPSWVRGYDLPAADRAAANARQGRDLGS